MSAQLPHGRDAAVRSVSGDSPELRESELQPLSVQTHERRASGIGLTAT
jgi:hypothetical protein